MDSLQARPGSGRERRCVLMVAYHFPPLAGSSGIQRTLRFVQHLPALGWQPIVLTTHPMAYERTSTDLGTEVPPDVHVERAFALDTARHLAIRGRHLGALARPDRWMTWRFDAVRRGLSLIQRFRPAAIWTTYPIATAHAIGARLQQASGLPWIADFRDPMAQEGYPADPATWQQFEAIERAAATRARICTFTTPSAQQTYGRRYPAAQERMRLLENGYDEGSFAQAGQRAAQLGPLLPGRKVLLHSGIVYPSERDPTQLFAALAQLKAQGVVGLTVRFRAAVHDALLHQLAQEHQVQDMVEILPAMPYVQALEEMLRADGLLLMQASNCNEQIPAKLYEYLRAGKPVLCLSDFGGDTWRVLAAAGVKHGARLDNANDIRTLVGGFVREGAAGLLASTQAVADASRAGRARQLARWLDECSPR